jgi:N-acetylmuramoyl-L-alanine amidase
MRRVPVLAVMSLLLGVMVVLSPVSAGATTWTVPTAAEQVTTSVTGERVVKLTAPAGHVAAYWNGSPRARVTLAFSTDGTQFSDPIDAGRDELGEQRANGVTYGAVQESHSAVAVRITSDRPIGHLTVLGLTDGPATTQRTLAPAAAAAATTQPAVVPRAEWGADESLMTFPPAFYPTKKLIVHHTATSNDYADRAGAESQIRAIYHYHAVTQAWGDIGYNFLIDKFGTIYEGRYSRTYPAGTYPSGDNAIGYGVTGAQTSGWNSGTVGVALLGTFTDQDITPAARAALEALLAWEASRNGIDPLLTEKFTNPVSAAVITTPNIAGHRDYNATACPGDTFYPTLPALRAAVAALIGGAAPPVDTTGPTAPSGLTAIPGSRKVTLTWDESTDSTGVVGYRVWRSTSSTGSFTAVATVASLTYVDSGLSRRRTYYYKVQAFDAAGNTSGYSTTVSARTS